MERERKINPACVNAANPFHECAGYCGQRSHHHHHHHPPKLAIAGAKSPVPNGEGRVIDPGCVNAANPFHQCADYCAKRAAEAKRQSESNSGHFAFPMLLKLSPKSSSQGSSGGKSVLNGERGKNVDPNCPNVSNPFHECGDYCKKKTTDVKKQIIMGKTVPNGESSKNVDPNCPNRSNPFHECGDYCKKKTTDVKKQIKGKTVQNGEIGNAKILKMEEGRRVDPTCVNASNAFHKCTENCSQRTPGATRQSNGHTLVQNGEIGNAEILKMDEGRRVDPTCVNASNAFHQCTENCSQRTPGAKRQSNGHTLEITPEPPQVLHQEC